MTGGEAPPERFFFSKIFLIFKIFSPGLVTVSLSSLQEPTVRPSARAVAALVEPDRPEAVRHSPALSLVQIYCDTVLSLVGISSL